MSTINDGEECMMGKTILTGFGVGFFVAIACVGVLHLLGAGSNAGVVGGVAGGVAGAVVAAVAGRKSGA